MAGKEDRKKPPVQNVARSLKYNLALTDNNRYNSAYVKFILKRLNYYGYGSQQFLIVRLIEQGYLKSDKFNSIREKIEREWEEEQLKK